MQQAIFDIELKQPLIISQQAASAGAHQSLDYLPGSTLLGLVAARLYARLSSDDAWLVFHSGHVRFGDALPVHAKHVGFPVPLCWHSYKGESAKKDGKFLAEKLFDPALKQGDETRQPVQVRSGYVTHSGDEIQPKRQQTLKTAIDRETGMAAESQLFGYEALDSGQHFRFTLSADACVEAALWQRIQDALKGVAQLGRSRSAQFGQVLITACAQKSTPIETARASDTLTLWLISDLALEEQGQPCLIPHPHLLGLPEGSRWLSESSFLRSRRYSPYNAFRRHYDSERQVITRGSVLRYALPRALTADELHPLEHGIGLHIESGLGQVLVNSALLQDGTPRFTAAKTSVSVSKVKTKPDAPSSRLISVLHSRLGTRLSATAVEKDAKIIFSGLCQRVSEARRYAACAQGVPIEAPNRSQWGLLKQFASDYRNQPNELWEKLTHPVDGVLRPRSGWNLRYSYTQDAELGIWLKNELEAHRKRSDFSALIGQLAVFGLQQAWLDCCAGITKKGTDQ